MNMRTDVREAPSLLPLCRGIAWALSVQLCLLPNASWAWGAQGHRITGLVAEAFLTPRARIAIHDLLNGESLADASTWMDEEKRRLGPTKAQWHYTNQAVCGAPTVRCPKGNCLTARLPGLVEAVGDTRLNSAQRAVALRMVIHLMGDLHQPLHVSDNYDRGGNDLTVVFSGARKPLRRTLHALWDVELVKQEVRGVSEERYAEKLIVSARANLEVTQRGTLGDWSSHAYTLAKEVAYADLPSWRCGASPSPSAVLTLDDRYLTTGRTVVRAQLGDAGVRLAQILNRALGY